MILVSACLAGYNCRYDGENCRNSKIAELVKNHNAIPVCPEVLGGLLTPRNPMEIVINDNKNISVLDNKGNDLTEQMLKGAYECLKIAKLNKVSYAILKSNSPSCGYGQIYNGTFTGILKEGNGITSQLLKDNGIEIYNEKNFEEL